MVQADGEAVGAQSCSESLNPAVRGTGVGGSGKAVLQDVELSLKRQVGMLEGVRRQKDAQRVWGQAQQ